MEPKISVIVPIYNSEKFLKKCIESILNQTYRHIEIILINDGSIDKSSQICDFYENKSNVTVKHIENCGAGGARNVGLKLATGDYISFVDSDDWIHPEMLKTMLSVSQKNNVNVVECDLIKVKNHINHSNFDKKCSTIIETKIQSLNRILSNQRFSVVVRLYKNEVLDNLYFREKIMSEDVYFTLEILSRISSLAVIPYKFYYYFANSESVTKKTFNLKKLDTLYSALFLQKKILENETDLKLIETTRKFVLEVIMSNYKKLHYNSELDPSMKYRKKIKKLIQDNYSLNDSSILINFARFLPIKVFNLSIKLNSLIKNKQ